MWGTDTSVTGALTERLSQSDDKPKPLVTLVAVGNGVFPDARSNL